MEIEQHERYEYARKRINQIKSLYLHFVLFLFILHFIKVYITDRFMNKDWEREQIERLMTLQQKKIDQLQTKTNNETPSKAQ